MKRSRARVSATVVVLLSVGILFAAPTIDQEQIVVDTTANTLAIGGASEQKLAQTFTAAKSGCLSHVTVPLGCEPAASLTVEIQETTDGVPSGTVLASETLPGTLYPQLSAAPVPGGFRIVEFTSPALITAGKQYAVVLSAAGDSCGIFQGPLGDPYLGGHGFFDARPNPPGWIQFFEGRDDLPFQTFVEETSKGKCKKCK